MATQVQAGDAATLRRRGRPDAVPAGPAPPLASAGRALPLGRPRLASIVAAGAFLCVLVRKHNHTKVAWPTARWAAALFNLVRLQNCLISVMFE